MKPPTQPRAMRRAQCPTATPAPWRAMAAVATAATLWGALCLGAHAAENKIRFSEKAPPTPGSPVPAPGSDNDLSIQDPQARRPGVDPLLTTPRVQPNAQRQRMLELYIDRERNWMFADPKELLGQTSNKDFLGPNTLTPNDSRDKKAIERYWERKQTAEGQSNTNKIRDGASADLEENRGNPTPQDAARNRPQEAQAPTLFQPFSAPSTFRLPDMLNPGLSERLGLPQSFTDGFAAPQPAPTAIAPAFGPASLSAPANPAAPADPLSLRLDSSASSLLPGTGRAVSSAADPAARSAGAALAPAALGAPALPSPASSLAPFNARLADPGSALAPVTAPIAPVVTVPRQPPVLEFPKRVF